jgi:hypothetical protein
VVLFFDHFEEATEEVTYWLRRHVLGLHLEEAAEFPNLWIIVAGRRVPFQDEVDQWRHVLRAHLVRPLPDEAIYLFWVDKRGLDPAHVSVIVPASGGNPQLLFLMANNFAKALGREQADE